jgi:Ca2+/H+ antiporter, TMEM165/GDT1 family
VGGLFLALGVVFVAELGDKTQLVVLTLGARQRMAAVLAGLAVTIALLQAIAVSAGAVIARIVPDRALTLAASALFFGFAVWTWRTAGRDGDDEVVMARGGSGVAAVCAAFFLAELGDKTQLTTAALAAEHGIAATWVGATLGLLAATVLALVAGRALASRVSSRTLARVGAGAFAAVGTITLVAGLRG